MSEYAEPEDIDTLIARQMAGFDPGIRYANSEPLGAHIVNWRQLPDADEIAIGERTDAVDIRAGGRG